MPKRHADPTLSMETRILAAELANARIAEIAAAVREILRELVASAVESDRKGRTPDLGQALERVLRKALQPYQDLHLFGYEFTDRDLPEIARRLLTAMAGEECLPGSDGA